ncbi:MAG TPA: glycosyl hydrolase family 65 protein, partial [Euzebyales bacterium]|nr:glycosyl hydrolase family 65 protein [Euzebyales bacterium]
MSVFLPDEEVLSVPARMRRRAFKFLPDDQYPVDEWRLIERSFTQRYLARVETLFSLSNGYLGMRGTHDEGRPVIERGTFINGFHEQWPIQHAEDAFGFATIGQTIVNVPDARTFHLYVDDEPLYLATADLQDYERVLDLREGTLTRDLIWLTPAGKRIHVRSQRLVSFEHRHLAAFQYEITVLDNTAPVVLSSHLRNQQDDRDTGGDPRLARALGHRVLEPVSHSVEDTRVVMGYRVANSGMTMATGIDHLIETDNECSYHSESDEDLGKLVLVVDAEPGVPIRLTKFATYHSSRSTPVRQLSDRARRTLDRAVRDGYDELVEAQRAYLDEFWERSDVQVRGNPAIQQAIRWNSFQLIQAAGRAEGTGIPAKGLTSSAYEGHYFWDTEIYVLPFLIYTAPRIARNLLRFRYSLLDHARHRARKVSQRGALFPWRTICGEEASAYYEAGTAQYHINADIIYALRKYVEVTDDEELLRTFGAEMLVETARLWADLGFFRDDGKGTFHIYGVTGPDEYTTLVNDNAYTNLMARLNLAFAADVVQAVRRDDPDRYAVLHRETGVTPEEIAQWRRAADSMFLPYDKERGIHPQDSNFLDKEVWDFANTPRDKYPLLLHFHPLVIYRFQVIKQADIVLAMFLLGHEFSREQKRRNFDYYDPLTTGDSSLSPSIQSIIAAELGYEDKAVEYFRNAAFMDLADVAGNTADGVHVASAGGVWMAAVYGFGGLRDSDGALSFDPRLPRTWDGLRFPIEVRGQRLTVDVTHDGVAYHLADGPPLEITHQGEQVSLT